MSLIVLPSRLRRAALFATAALSCMTVRAPAARACGGLFCSGGGSTTTTQASFVNQTAERIVFIDNADGTVTAIIQIVYEGPADRFAWILPVPGVPEVKVSSNAVLDALQQQTNPQYQVMTTRLACPVPSGGNFFGGGSCTCGQCAASPAGLGGTGGLAPPSVSDLGGPAVVIEAAGSIGPYDYTVLSVNPLAFDPATVAIDWLTQNEFDIGELGPEVLRPYLQDGLNLLAFRLNKQATVGSIRPVMLSYPAELASIPIRPTAVAANEDMGVLVWIAAEAQAVPMTYSSVVLNEAVIDWFNPASNYAAVVSAAADEAGGRAFATEFAGTFTAVPPLSRAHWAAFTGRAFADWREMVSAALAAFGTFDGFDEALGAAATLQEGTTLADLTRCLPALADAAAPGLEDCAALLTATGDRAVQVDMEVFQQKLDELVVSPVTDSFAALAAQPYLTRLYTTLSPDEMTVDPVFVVNADLPPVSNLHTTSRTVPCGSVVGTMQLPQGATIVTDANGNAWPVQTDQLPAALQIVQHGFSGPGRVLVDETASVAGKTFGVAACRGQFGGTAGSSGSASSSSSPGSGSAGDSAGSLVPGVLRGDGEQASDGPASKHDACRASGDGTAGATTIGAMLLAVLGVRLRRRPSARQR